MDDIYRKIEECNPNKKRKVTKYYKKFNPLVTVLFIRCRKLNTFLVFIRQSQSAELKNVRKNSTHHFITKIPNKQELQQIAFDHSSDIAFQDFINLYKEVAAKPYSFLVIDATLASHNPFRKKLL